MKDLARCLNILCDAQPFQTNWFLKDLRTGETADRGGDVIVPSASTRKMSIMMAALKGVHDGRFSLNEPVTMLAKYQDNDSGTFQHLTPGFTITFRDVLVMMIIVSDNTCTGTVVDMVGLDELNAYSKAIGLRGTTHYYGLPPRGPGRGAGAKGTVTTANDSGLLLDTILAGAGGDMSAAGRLGSTPELCRLGLDILSWQKLNTRLPSLLPAGTKVAHKTGTGPHVFNDAGIIYQGDQPLFILTAYTIGVPFELPDGMPGFAGAAQLIGRLARTAFNSLKK